MAKKQRFKNVTAAALFYGIARRQFLELKALGKKVRLPMPVEDPAAMPAWFEKLIAKGHRQRKCPASVLARAAEVKKPGKKPAAASKSKDGPPPAAVISLGEEASYEQIISGKRQLFRALNEEFLKLLAAGQGNTPAATLVERRLQAVEKSIIDLTKNLKHVRVESDYMLTGEVKAGAAEFAAAFFALLRRELTTEFPAGDHEKVMGALDRLADRLPSLLPSQFAA